MKKLFNPDCHRQSGFFHALLGRSSSLGPRSSPGESVCGTKQAGSFRLGPPSSIYYIISGFRNSLWKTTLFIFNDLQDHFRISELGLGTISQCRPKDDGTGTKASRLLGRCTVFRFVVEPEIHPVYYQWFVGAFPASEHIYRKWSGRKWKNTLC